tara:strand:+ start:2144 stop:2404 length:261 start_codon:yes stop_codon:yes gene_type:complete
MRSSHGQRALLVLGVLCAAVGLLAWIVVGWSAFSDLEGMTAKSDEGGRLMVRGLTGTVLMIVGMILLHVAEDAPEGLEEEGSELER